jgi:hypothetical protein
MEIATRWVAEHRPDLAGQHLAGVTIQNGPGGAGRFWLLQWAWDQPKMGGEFAKRFGPGLEFRLEPEPEGWTITLHQEGRDEDLARLTPPLHTAPNPRDILAWHLAGGERAREGNAPGRVRLFIFSPEVGRSVAGPDARQAVSAEDVARVRAYGEGTLRVTGFKLGLSGGQQTFVWMRFEAELRWNAGAVSSPGQLPEGKQN